MRLFGVLYVVLRLGSTQTTSSRVLFIHVKRIIVMNKRLLDIRKTSLLHSLSRDIEPSSIRSFLLMCAL